MPIRISLRNSGLVKNYLQSIPDKATIAQRTAIRKTVEWAHAQVSKKVAQAGEVPLFAVKNQIRLFSNNSGDEGRVWTGLKKEMPVRYLAKTPFELLRQMHGYKTKNGRPRGGIKLRKFSFSGAFVAPIGNGSSFGVFKRVGAARLPIEQVRMNINPFLKPAFDSVAPQVDQVLLKKLRQELNYQLKVKNAAKPD